MKKIITLVIIAFTAIPGFSQQDFTLYNMKQVPQAGFSNPATMPYHRINVSLPFITPVLLAPMPTLPSTYYSGSNSGFVLNDLMQVRSDDSLEIDMANLITKLKPKNYWVNNFEFNLLYVGFKVKKNYFSFSVNEKINTTLTYPKDLFVLLWEGNGGESLLGNRAAFDGIGFDLMHYREYGLNYARDINDKLTVGAKVKYLYGMENIYTKKSDWGLHTDETTFDLTFDADMELYTSGVGQYLDSNSTETFEVNQYLFGKKNRGLGIDLGAHFKPIDKVTISASIIDLGRIKWNDNNYNYAINGEFKYSGVDILDLLATADTSAISVGESDTASAVTLLRDSLTGEFDFTKNNDSYSTPLPTKFYVGGSYELASHSKVGILGYGTFTKGKLRPGISASYTYNFRRWFTANVNYSAYHRGFNNLGVGLALNLGWVQFYAASDNVLWYVAPNKFRNAHVRMGVNYTFGSKPADTDGDGIGDRKDKCPNTPGLAKFDGCPDTDLDNIPDDKDLCPTVFGVEQFLGCPDTDGDGIGDLDDDCVDVPGVAEFNGCPDTDGDGISDADDECPEHPGTEEHDGCPDTDGDGLVDSMDECPEKPGLPANFGCPITKLSAMSADGLTLMTVEMNEDGFFVFENLPVDQQYLFKMEGEDVFLTDELLIVLKNDGEEEIIAANQTSSKHNYEYLPPAKSAMTLFIVDDEGNVLRTGEMDAFGNFVFENLPTDKNYLFKLNGEDVELGDDIQVLIRNADGDYRMTVKPSEAAGFDFQFLPNDQYGLALVEYSDEGTLVPLTIEEEVVVKEAFSNLEFNHSSAIIRQHSFRTLDKLATLMKEHENWKLVLTGYTDNTGTEMQNLALSKRRADAVKRRLVTDGIDNDKIIVKYFGEANPIEDNSTEEGRQKNRRVEMEFVD